jgi:NADH-ubiquinone oxidoreductase chain 5
MLYVGVVNGLVIFFICWYLFFVIFILLIFTTSLNSNIVLKSGFLVLILGACVKRAQFPFNAWLLAAIRAPTPISSLVHSSTLVVAGVYILLQYSYCLIERLNILKYLRILTLVVRLFGLINEFDIKKLIAYSTIRHVGLILFLIRIQLYKITFFHLVVHAMFKSLIFMCFGFTILRSFHRQDKRLVSYINLSPIIKILYYYACFLFNRFTLFKRVFFLKILSLKKQWKLILK